VGHLIGGEAEQSHFAGLLKYLVDGEMAIEDEVAAVFDLIDGVLAIQGDGFAILLGELRPQQPTPVVQAFFDGGSGELVGGRL
jgi:hypothetical protein